MANPLRSALRNLLSIGSREEHWCRVVMNRETRTLVESLSPLELSVLEISGDSWKTPGQFKSYKSLHFPDYDVCSTVLDEKFDLIIAEQVFEHLAWPYRAGRNVLATLNRGGHFLITTPFLNRVHEHPIDCCRWTEAGLKYFLAECGFPLGQIRTGSWGNRTCIIANFRSWVRYRPWLHSLKNEAQFPIVVWALAAKDAPE